MTQSDWISMLPPFAAPDPRPLAGAISKNTMRAISQDTFGGPEVLHEVLTERPKPISNEVLVAVHAAGLNPTDRKHRAGSMRFGEPPFTLGEGVTPHQVGDEVFGLLPYPNGHGADAEYVAAPARAFVPKPAGLSHVEAAALPLAAMTAWQVLVDTADVQPGQRVLIHAAAGGVGHLAVQIAVSRGVYVIGTASGGKHDFVRSLGADEIIDYRTQDFVELARDMDLVIAPFIGEDRLRSLAHRGRGRPGLREARADRASLTNHCLRADDRDRAGLPDPSVRLWPDLVQGGESGGGVGEAGA